MKSITLLTKQISKVVKKFKSMNSTNFREEMVKATIKGIMKIPTEEIVKARSSNVGSVEELVIIRLNVPRFWKSRRRVFMLHYLMKKLMIVRKIMGVQIHSL